MGKIRLTLDSITMFISAVKDITIYGGVWHNSQFDLYFYDLYDMTLPVTAVRNISLMCFSLDFMVCLYQDLGKVNQNCLIKNLFQYLTVIERIQYLKKFKSGRYCSFAPEFVGLYEV